MGYKKRNKMRKIFFDRYGDLRPFWFVVFIVIGSLLLILSILALVGAIDGVAEYAKCSNLESIDQINQYDWSLWSGCRVQTSAGFFVDVDSSSIYELIHETSR